MKRISRKFFNLLKSSNLAPEEVAKKLGVDLLTFSKWKSGDEPVPAETVQHLQKLIDSKNGTSTHKFKTKYLVCTIIFGIILLFGLILSLTVKPYLVKQWTLHFRTWIIWYMVYIEGALYATAGAFLPALVSLKSEIVVCRKLRWLLLLLGAVSILLYLYIGVWNTFSGFGLPRILRPLVQGSTFQKFHRIAPFFFGLTAFLGINH